MNSYHLAEAGLNTAISRLELADDPRVATLLPSTTLTYSDGSTVTYAGTALDANNEIKWTITSTGTSGTASKLTHKRTLTQTLFVPGLVPGGDLGSWSRFYQDSSSKCLTIDHVSMPTNIATKGGLCLIDGGTITGAGTTIDVGGDVSIIGPLVTTSAHQPSTGAGWTNPTNVFTNNSAYATNTPAVGATGANQDTTNFGFAIPAGAKILGISAKLERMASACCNAVQTISETGSPTSGTFKLKGTPPGGSLTTSISIAYNASASTVQSALVSIYGSGNVSCGGGSLPGTAVVCTFQGSDGYQPIVAMTFTKSLTPSSATPVITNTTVGSDGALQDGTVQLLKAGSPVGSNQAVTGAGTNWDTSPTTVTYGDAADLWATTWTAADLNASNFGLRFSAKNTAAASSTASLDYVTITVTYNDDTAGIGTSSVPISDSQIGGTCTYNGQSPDNPCIATDKIYSKTIENTAPDVNTDLVMPHPDFQYWFQNAKPGPKHPCTNSGNGLYPLEFDNDNSTTSNDSLQFDNSSTYDMTPLARSYDCQFVENGVTVGQLKWDYPSHCPTRRASPAPAATPPRGSRASSPRRATA